MSSNNYFGFTHGGTQYGQPGSYTPTQTPYAVTPTAYAAAAAAQRTGYESAYTPTAASNTNPAATAYAGTYGVPTGTAAPAATYDYGYARTAATAATTYDTTPKTYYQQPVAATYTSTDYQQAQTPQPVAATYSTSYATAASPQTPQTPQIKHDVTVATKKSLAKFVTQTMTVTSVTYPAQSQTPQTAAAVQSPAASAYSTNFATQIQTTSSLKATPQWPTYKKNFTGGAPFLRKLRAAPQPLQLHYCEVCKISCGGILTYKEHLEGQKHKKKEEAAKGQTNTQPNRHGSSLVCELCDVTCTGADAYSAHIRGSKHQKVVKLHKILGKPIPATEPVVPKKKEDKNVGKATSGSGTEGEGDDMDTVEPEVEPVGQDYIEELKSDDGKLTFNCKLCDCRFNDPNAKEMHMKGRRHRLQYKRKVDPQLVVDVKMNSRTKRMHEDRLKRAQEREFFRGRNEPWGGYPIGPPIMGRGPFGPDGPPIPPMMPMRPFDPSFFPPMRMHRLDSTDDRHVMFRHSVIYPKREELDAVQKIVSHNEKALKMVSDNLAAENTAKQPPTTPTTTAITITPPTSAAKVTVATATSSPTPDSPVAPGSPTSEVKTNGESTIKEEPKKPEGGDGTLFSFQPSKEEQQYRILKGAMRVGSLAKNLLLTGDTAVDLVVICAEKPTRTLLLKVAELLPKQLQTVAPDEKYMVQKKPEDAAISVMDTKEPHITVTITFTSPVMREQPAPEADGKPAVVGSGKPPTKDPPDVLDKAKCLDALAALRHAKWFQARAHGLQSCVIVIRILRDLCQRVPTWAPLNSWAMELLAEKVISSANAPLSVGDALRRVMEAIACGVLLASGPGLMDPCEKEPVDALGSISSQQREDITASAQHALRLIAYRQVHKVLGMDMLPPPKFMGKHARYPRKRRREGSVDEGDDGDGEGKKVCDEDVAQKQEQN